MKLATKRSRMPATFWPYLLLTPATLALFVILGYPVIKLVILSLQKYGLTEIISGKGKWIGFLNFTSTFQDAQFWVILFRTLIVTFGIVATTIIVGAALAHLMMRMHPIIRKLLNVTLILVWAMPQLVSISVWRWIFSYDFSIFTVLLRDLGFSIGNHDYFVNTFSGFLIIGGCVAWGALPFVVISLYAALTQVPKDLIEAAEIDGASKRQVFRNITFPILKPVYVILITLSVIWDFQIFAHIWVFLEQRPSNSYYTMAIYAFEKSFGLSEYGKGAAISLIMIAVLMLMTFKYLRTMIKIGTQQ